MIINLIKKDLILVKKYLVISLLFAVLAPIFITSKLEINDGGLISFFITVVYLEYMLLSTIWMSEEKYKGAALLITTPYTRKPLVQAKYIFILLIFICNYLIYTVLTFIVPFNVERLSIYNFGLSLLIISIYFGMIIPMQYKFGYEKTKYISFAILFMFPFLSPKIINWVYTNNINFKTILPVSSMLQDIMPMIFSIIIGYISMLVSISIYSKKNL